MADRRVVVIGAGVVGLSVARSALDRGFPVTVLERESPEHEGCSFGNAGMIVPSHFVPLAAPGMVGLGLRMMLNPESPFWMRPRLDRDWLTWAWRFARSASASHVERSAPLLRDLHLASRALYEELDSLPGADFGLQKRGLLMLCETEKSLQAEREAVEMACRLGMEGAILGPAEIAAMEPGMRMCVAGAGFYPQDCHLVPRRLMAFLRRRVESDGGEIRWNTKVTGWRASGSRVQAAITRDVEVEADEFVISGGSWSPRLLRPLGIRLPLEAGKGYSLTLRNPPRMPALGSILMEGRVATTPMGASLRFAGTMEMGGLSLDQNPRRVHGIIKTVCRAFPDFTPDHFRDVEPWCGLRPCSPDGLPFIGRFRRYPNLIAATGHAMLGLSLGPITGKLIAEILAGDRPSIPLELLGPDRM